MDFKLISFLAMCFGWSHAVVFGTGLQYGRYRRHLLVPKYVGQVRTLLEKGSQVSVTFADLLLRSSVLATRIVEASSPTWLRLTREVNSGFGHMARMHAPGR